MTLRIVGQAVALTLGAALLVPLASLAQEVDTSDWMPWRDPNNPAVHLLDPDDPTNEAWNARRDTSNDPERTPGLYNPQRYATGFLSVSGFPTFFGAPIAANTEDLRAGKVDVAVVGLTAEQQAVPGARFAANVLRAMPDWMLFSSGGGAVDQYVRTDYLKDLVVADYGNVSSHWTIPERGIEEVRTVIGEILAADAVPLMVGGTHIQAYGIMMALAEKYGPGEFAMVHIDAHYDAYKSLFGNYAHNGTFIRMGVEKGLINGEDLIQVGLRGVSPSDADLAWMRENKLRYHFAAEVRRDGWEAVLKRIFEEVEGKKVYISFDMDGIDPAFFAAVATQSIGGMTTEQAMDLVRGLAIQNDVVAVELSEYVPLLDDRHLTGGIQVDRLMRTFLAGHAARKQGITDPFYLAPEVLDHGGGVE